MNSNKSIMQKFTDGTLKYGRTFVTKAHILQEIQRTSKTNNGVPLGRQKFEAETGIRRSDWYGVHWARWGDALLEAGFTPNEFQGAYDKTDLLDSYAKLVMEIGHLPTNGEIRLKERRDPGFPAHTTWDKRFGNKSELVKQLLEYC